MIEFIYRIPILITIIYRVHRYFIATERPHRYRFTYRYLANLFEAREGFPVVGGVTVQEIVGAKFCDSRRIVHIRTHIENVHFCIRGKKRGPIPT